jgi:hypothetical protein
MNPLKRWLAMLLATALSAPAAAAGQEPTGLPQAAPSAHVEIQGQVRLTFNGRRPADPWAVFGTANAATVRAEPGGSVTAVATNGSFASRPRTLRLDSVVPVKSPAAARTGMAGQSQSSNAWWAERPYLLLIAVVAGVVVLFVTGNADLIPWFSGR